MGDTAFRSAGAAAARPLTTLRHQGFLGGAGIALYPDHVEITRTELYTQSMDRIFFDEIDHVAVCRTASPALVAGAVIGFVVAAGLALFALAAPGPAAFVLLALAAAAGGAGVYSLQLGVGRRQARLVFHSAAFTQALLVPLSAAKIEGDFLPRLVDQIRRHQQAAAPAPQG